MNPLAGFAVAVAVGLVPAALFGLLWLSALNSLRRTEEERDRLWDMQYGAPALKRDAALIRAAAEAADRRDGQHE